jgi:DnaJ-class molecular chaperone
MKNYYLILGVTPDSTLEQIKAAYRQQAKDLHPDYYGQDSEPFREIQEAYAVLSDPARRRAYDRLSGHTPLPVNTGYVWAEPLIPRQQAPEPLIPMDEPVDLGDLSLSHSFRTFGPSFAELFDRLWQNFSLIKPKVEQLQPLHVEIQVSPREVVSGGQVRLFVPARLSCPYCRGRGGIGLFECWQCGGIGQIQGEYPVSITFPPGIVNNHIVQLSLDQLGISNFYLNVVFRVAER